MQVSTVLQNWMVSHSSVQPVPEETLQPALETGQYFGGIYRRGKQGQHAVVSCGRKGLFDMIVVLNDKQVGRNKVVEMF